VIEVEEEIMEDVMAPKATVVNMRREKYDVKIDRTTKWGNPYVIGEDGDRDEVIRLYRAYLLGSPKLMEALRAGELKGKKLGCWCKPGPCHGDILIEGMELMEDTENE